MINASVLGMGLLTPHGPPAWHPAPAELQAAARAAARAADARAVDLPKLATMFSVAHPGIATHLIGFSTPDQVRDGRSSVAGGQHLLCPEGRGMPQMPPDWQDMHGNGPIYSRRIHHPDGPGLVLTNTVSFALQTSSLKSMVPTLQVRNAVHAVLQAQGLEENAQAEQEERAMVEIREILAGTAQVTWPSGLPENSDEQLAAR